MFGNLKTTPTTIYLSSVAWNGDFSLGGLCTHIHMCTNKRYVF